MCACVGSDMIRFILFYFCASSRSAHRKVYAIVRDSHVMLFKSRDLPTKPRCCAHLAGIVLEQESATEQEEEEEEGRGEEQKQCPVILQLRDEVQAEGREGLARDGYILLLGFLCDL